MRNFLVIYDVCDVDRFFEFQNSVQTMLDNFVVVSHDLSEKKGNQHYVG